MAMCRETGCTNKAQTRAMCRKHYDEQRAFERAYALRTRQREAAEVRPAVESTLGRSPRRPKSLAVAYVLWLLLGLLGGHRFYLGNPLVGIAMLLTLGGLGVWWVIDAFLIPRAVRARSTP